MPPKKQIPPFETIANVFYLPLKEAAEQLGVCDTLVKRFCRFYGIKKWPYRKFVLLNKLISQMRYNSPFDTFAMQAIQQQIEMEMEELMQLYHDPIFARKSIHKTLERLKSRTNEQKLVPKFPQERVRLPSFAELMQSLQM